MERAVDEAAHRQSPNQPQYFKSSTLRGSQGNLGWRCTSNWPRNIAISEFPKNPGLEIEFEFANDDYARLFSAENGVKILGE